MIMKRPSKTLVFTLIRLDKPKHLAEECFTFRKLLGRQSCPSKNSHKGIVIGRGGAMLKRIGTLARREIEELAGGQVFLKLFVKVRKDWRDNELLLKNYGYYKKKES